MGLWDDIRKTARDAFGTVVSMATGNIAGAALGAYSVADDVGLIDTDKETPARQQQAPLHQKKKEQERLAKQKAVKEEKFLGIRTTENGYYGMPEDYERVSDDTPLSKIKPGQYKVSGQHVFRARTPLTGYDKTDEAISILNAQDEAYDRQFHPEAYVAQDKAAARGNAPAAKVSNGHRQGAHSDKNAMDLEAGLRAQGLYDSDKRFLVDGHEDGRLGVNATEAADKFLEGLHVTGKENTLKAIDERAKKGEITPEFASAMKHVINDGKLATLNKKFHLHDPLSVPDTTLASSKGQGVAKPPEEDKGPKR